VQGFAANPTSRHCIAFASATGASGNTIPPRVVHVFAPCLATDFTDTTLCHIKIESA